jgi:adenylate cyclase
MKPYSRRRISASVKLGLASMMLYVALRVLSGDEFVKGFVVVGFGLGFAVGIAELFVLRKWLRNAPFLVHLLGKSVAIVVILISSYALLDLLDVATGEKTWFEYAEQFVSYGFFVGVSRFFGVIVFLIFFVHLDRLLGPGVLFGYVTGRFHRPRREERIFMFLDLKGSTKLADAMEAERYYQFLHRYFVEMSDPILETQAEIYQYVGDEVVLSWKIDEGIRDASCLRVFFLIEDQLARHREQFLADYGVLPEFKAGLHAGEVISAQIGELKSEIVYNGDVLNTTARIQSMCNELDEKLLVSKELMERIHTGPLYAIYDKGPVALRGKEEAVRLLGVRRAEIDG